MWAVATISTLGKAFVTFSFGTIYLYTAELYPTVLRTTGMGASSFMARYV
jgi:OCT family organic cation transporter-like MFS transporter 4/5